MVSIAEARKHLNALLAKVRQGETTVITEHGRPVARLAPVDGGERIDVSERLARLERTGVIRRSRAQSSRVILETRPPRAARGVSVLRELLAQRGTKRRGSTMAKARGQGSPK